MNPDIAAKLREAEASLGLEFPKKLFDLIRKLEVPVCFFGGSEWIFPIAEFKTGNVSDNSIVSFSVDFQKIWGLNALVFAENKSGDRLILLQKNGRKMRKEIFVLEHKTCSLKIFNYSIEKLLLHGPLEYELWEEYYFKLQKGLVVSGKEYREDEED